MSAIFGVFHLDGRPVEMEDMECVQRSVAARAPGAAWVWRQAQVGLGGLALSYPWPGKNSAVTLTAAARLDNRAELLRIFEIPKAEHAAVPDDGLIGMAYERWGKECPAHLLGDWAFAVWDARLRGLFLARDHFGVSSLFYYRQGRQFAFASSIKRLLAFQGVPSRLNLQSLGGAGLKTDASTPYQDIWKLTPGQAALITADRFDLWQYWRLQDIPDVRLKSDQEYLDAFLEIYTEAVRCRLRTPHPVGLMLSGGLDSGSIAVLAAQELARQGQTLHAYSAIPFYEVGRETSKKRLGDESPLIEATCRAAGNINLAYIRGENLSLVAAIKLGVEICDLPFVNANINWILDLLSRAQSDHIGVMLDGWGGNFTVSWTGNRVRYLRQLLAGWQWRAYLREVRAWSRVHQTPIWRDLLEQVLPPVWSEQLLHRRIDRKYILHPGLHRRLRKEHAERVIDAEASGSLNPGLFHYYRSGQGVLSALLAAAFGIEARQPTLDRRLIEFCLGIPQDQHIREGQERLLLRRAMAGRLPEAVLWPPRRGVQSADLARRLLAGEAEIREALLTLRRSQVVNCCLDLSRAEAALHLVREQPDSVKAVRAAGMVVKSLATGFFLQRFEADPGDVV